MTFSFTHKVISIDDRAQVPFILSILVWDKRECNEPCFLQDVFQSLTKGYACSSRVMESKRQYSTVSESGRMLPLHPRVQLVHAFLDVTIYHRPMYGKLHRPGCWALHSRSRRRAHSHCWFSSESILAVFGVIVFFLSRRAVWLIILQGSSRSASAHHIASLAVLTEHTIFSGDEPRTEEHSDRKKGQCQRICRHRFTGILSSSMVANFRRFYTRRCRDNYRRIHESLKMFPRAPSYARGNPGAGNIRMSSSRRTEDTTVS